MMNVLAVCFVLTSLVTAGVWSPPPDKQTQKDNNVIVKEGHRVVVVEYDKGEDGNTKVLISPQDEEVHVSQRPQVGDKSPEKSKDDGSKEGQGGLGSGPRELVCDAFGKCKHKISSALGRTKETVGEKANQVLDKMGEKTHNVVDKLSDLGEEAKKAVKEPVDKLKEPVVETAKEGVAQIGRGTKDVLGNVREKIDTEAVKEKAKNAVETVKNETQKDLSEILGRGKDVVHDVLTYVVSLETLSSLMGVVHLLGFCSAYGMCVWVTFVSSYVLAGALPRQQFGMVQSKIYPVYFTAMAYAVGMALVGHILSQRKRVFSSGVEMFQGGSLLVSVLMILANLLYLEPRATKVMLEKTKMEKEEGKGRDGFIAEPTNKVAADRARTIATSSGSLTMEESREGVDTVKSHLVRMNEMLKKLNTYSSFLNVLSLMALTCHLAYLGQRLRLTL